MMNSNEPVVWGAALALALAVGALIAWLATRRRAFLSGRASRDGELAQLLAERDAAGQIGERLQAELGRASSELQAQRASVIDLSARHAEGLGRLERLAQVEMELKERRAEALRLIEARQRAEQQSTEYATRLHEQKQAAQERIALFERSLNDKFKTLSSELLEGQSQKFAAQNEANLGTLLNPLREQLSDFRKRVDEVYDKESRERGLLKHEIDSLKNLNQRISEEAVNLTQALKADSKTRGAWGEMVLERLLEMAGLQAGRQFETQASFAADSGRQRPDVIVHLPDDKDIVIDAKVSLIAWERYTAAADDVERASALRDHLAAIRRNVDDLYGKDYSSIPHLRTLDFVLMFIPIESAFVEAVRVDDRLYGYALAKNVSIVSPSTLLATLRTVAHLWRIEQRNVNSLEFARVAAQLHDNFTLLVEGLQEVGERLDQAKTKHEVVVRRLTEGGRGSVLLQVQRLKELGADTKKKLPRELLERAGATVDDADAEPQAAEEATQLPLKVLT